MMNTNTYPYLRRKAQRRNAATQIPAGRPTLGRHAPRRTFTAGTHEASGCPTITTWRESDAIVIVNASDRDWSRHSYLLSFGAYGWTRLLVWENSLDDAFETAAEWLVEHAPGHVVVMGSRDYDDLMREACEESGLEWPIPPGALIDDDALAERYWQAEDAAMVDSYRTEAGWIHEWSVALEDPTRADLAAYVEGIS